MWVQPRGAQPTKEDYEAIVKKIEELERKVAELQKRGRPKKEANETAVA